MDGNGKRGPEATEPATLLLIVCTRCLALRKEPLGRATAVCDCGGRRRILRVVQDEPAAEPRAKRGGGSRGGANRGGANRGGANGRFNGRANGRL